MAGIGIGTATYFFSTRPSWERADAKRPGEGGGLSICAKVSSRANPPGRAESRKPGLAMACRALALSGALLLTACGPEWLVGDAGGSCTLAAAEAVWQPGCATRHNLAALVDRPADLRRPRRETPRDASRRDTVIAAYRDGDGQPVTAKTGERQP